MRYEIVAIANLVGFVTLILINPILSFACLFAAGMSTSLAIVNYQGRLL